MIIDLKTNDGRYEVSSDNLQFIVQYYRKTIPRKGRDARFELGQKRKFDTLEGLLTWILQKKAIHEGGAKDIEQLLQQHKEVLAKITEVCKQLERGDTE